MTDFEDFLDNDPDRRSSERIPFKQTFEIIPDAGSQSIFGLGEDISEGGIKFVCEKEALHQLLSEEEQRVIQEENEEIDRRPFAILLNADFQLQATIRSISQAEADKSGWDAGRNLVVSREEREGVWISAKFINLEESQKNKLIEYLKNLS